MEAEGFEGEEMKEIYISAHEEMMDEYMEQHPDTTKEEAYERTADAAWDRMNDKLAAIADSRKDAE